METLNLLFEFCCIWPFLLAAIVLAVVCYTKSKDWGWLLIGGSILLNVFNKIIATIASFWIRESVKLDDLGGFSSFIKLLTTLIGVLIAILLVGGIFKLFKSYQKK